jgi:hypothetical protein
MPSVSGRISGSDGNPSSIRLELNDSAFPVWLDRRMLDGIPSREVRRRGGRGRIPQPCGIRRMQTTYRGASDRLAGCRPNRPTAAAPRLPSLLPVLWPPSSPPFQAPILPPPPLPPPLAPSYYPRPLGWAYYSPFSTVLLACNRFGDTFWRRKRTGCV